jgi:hypothetical protein
LLAIWCYFIAKQAIAIWQSWIAKYLLAIGIHILLNERWQFGDILLLKQKQ